MILVRKKMIVNRKILVNIINAIVADILDHNADAIDRVHHVRSSLKTASLFATLFPKKRIDADQSSNPYTGRSVRN